MNEIILVGGGGHCKSVIDTIRESGQLNIVGILDLKSKLGSMIEGFEVIGTDDELEGFLRSGICFAFITTGSIGIADKRVLLYEKVRGAGFKFPVIVDKTAIVSKSAVIGYGTFVGKGAIINSGAIVGENCIINTGAIIEHECRIGDCVHIAPGSTLSADVVIGNYTHIGTNSTIIQGVKVGAGTLIGAGSVVVRDISCNVKAYGNPCKEV